MKLVGLSYGNYEGNNYARLHFLERIDKDKGVGESAIVSKANYNYCMIDLLPQIEMYLGKEVYVYYDRFGKVSEIRLYEGLT